MGVATGLAYTTVGGDTLQIEVSLTPGKGKLQLTGKLGEVMKESAQTALSYVRTKMEHLNVDAEFLILMIFISMYQRVLYLKMDHQLVLQWQQLSFRLFYIARFAAR